MNGGDTFTSLHFMWWPSKLRSSLSIILVNRLKLKRMNDVISFGIPFYGLLLYFKTSKWGFAAWYWVYMYTYSSVLMIWYNIYKFIAMKRNLWWEDFLFLCQMISNEIDNFYTRYVLNEYLPPTYLRVSSI